MQHRSITKKNNNRVGSSTHVELTIECSVHPIQYFEFMVGMIYVILNAIVNGEKIGTLKNPTLDIFMSKKGAFNFEFLTMEPSIIHEEK